MNPSPLIAPPALVRRAEQHDTRAIQALDSAHVADMIDTVPHADRPQGLRVLANPIRLDGARLPNRASPKLGADSDAVLTEAGFGAAEIARLRADGIV